VFGVNSSEINSRAACPELCAILINYFGEVRVGFRPSQFFVDHYSRRDVRKAFNFLKLQGCLEVAVARDVNGKRYGGWIVKARSLGATV